jgi:tetratricopeptide (TPR) repeat protein
MHPSVIRGLGLLASALYGSLILWLYATQPQTVAQVTGGLTASIGAYHIDQQAFDDGLAFFRRDQFVEARAAFTRADSAQRDARTQFYLAYSYYRQGWGRVYNDDALFKEGLTAVDRAIALAPDHRIVVDDSQLLMRTGDELRAELQRGLTHDASDFNPLRLFRARK